MQISAANMLLAGQQQAKSAQQPQTAASAFGHALNGTGKAAGAAAPDGFESLLFKQTAAPATAPGAPAATGPAQPYAAAKPPGSQLDIRA